MLSVNLSLGGGSDIKVINRTEDFWQILHWTQPSRLINIFKPSPSDWRCSCTPPLPEHWGLNPEPSAPQPSAQQAELPAPTGQNYIVFMRPSCTCLTFLCKTTLIFSKLLQFQINAILDSIIIWFHSHSDWTHSASKANQTSAAPLQMT